MLDTGATVEEVTRKIFRNEEFKDHFDPDAPIHTQIGRILALKRYIGKYFLNYVDE